MTIGVGGSTAAIELAKLSNVCTELQEIELEEYRARISRAQALMQRENIDAIYLNAGTNLFYFTGTKWHASERMVGAILPAQGELVYIVPFFEQGTVAQFMHVKGAIAPWQEHESPYQLFCDTLKTMGIQQGTIGIDEATPFFISHGIDTADKDYSLVSATSITAGCRAIKSDAELALMQKAKDITLSVQKAAASILYEGISTKEVEAFIDAAHKKMGASKVHTFALCFLE